MMRSDGGPDRCTLRLTTALRPGCLLLTTSLLVAVAGHSAETVPPISHGPCAVEQSLRWRGGTVRFENDLLAATDRNYTNGVALALVSHDMEGKLRPDCLPRPLGLYTRFLGWVDPGFWSRAGAESASQNLVVRFGQAMYTPEDDTRTDLIRDDRPYAGLLYLGLAWNRRVRPQDAGYEMLDSRELTLGVIGPWSLAEQSQDLVHRLRGIERFGGWDHQLRSEPAFQMAREHKFKSYVVGAVRPGWSSDVIGSYPIRPGGENRPPSAATGLRSTQPRSAGAPRPGVHAFAHLEAKTIAWDFSLDGNLFRDSHHVSRRPWVGQAAAGISGQWLVAGHGIRLAVMRVWRTREFDEQRGSHAFGSVALSWEL